MKRTGFKTIYHFFHNYKFLVLVLLFSACEDDAQLEDVVRFERVSDLTWERNNVGNLEVFNNRLFFSNNRVPGFLELGGNRKQLDFRGYDQEFDQIFTDQFMAGVTSDRENIVIVPHVFLNGLAVLSLNRSRIPNIPSGFRLVEGAPGNFSFGMNENFLISSWENLSHSDNPDEDYTVFILDLKTMPDALNDGLVIDRANPVNRKIPVLFDEGNSELDRLLSVFPYEEGWIASGDISGNSISFLVNRDGQATPIRNDNLQFVITSFDEGVNGGIFLTTEDGLYYSQTGNPFDLTKIGTFENDLKIKILIERMLIWGEGDRIFELKSYTNPSEAKLVELENGGLEEVNVLNIEYFDGDFYIATDNGLFSKHRNDFLVEKSNPQEIDFLTLEN